jgi:hypothetical protein
MPEGTRREISEYRSSGIESAAKALTAKSSLAMVRPPEARHPRADRAGTLLVLGDRGGRRWPVGLAVSCGDGLGFRVAAVSARSRWRVGPREQPADLPVHSTQIGQQPVMELAHLLALALQCRPLVLGLPADLVGELACLGQPLLGLAGDLRSKLLGLLLPCGRCCPRVAGPARPATRPSGPPPGAPLRHLH